MRSPSRPRFLRIPILAAILVALNLEAAGPSYRVASMEKIADGIFPVWSPDGGTIAFTRQRDDTFEVYTMKPNGRDQRCLTCGKSGLRETGYRGQPFWHPSGRYIAFVAENTAYPRKGTGVTSRPGLGRNNNVWILDIETGEFWQMTDYEENWGVIRPSFSNDGTKLYWNEEFSMEKYPPKGHFWGLGDAFARKGEELGAWRVKWADIDFRRGRPRLKRIHTVDPPDGFTLLEGSGFTPDDRRLIYSYVDLSESPGGRGLRGDIYTTDLEGSSLRRLTRTPTQHDENAVFSPDGQKIAWCHPVGKGRKGMPGSGEELYLMNPDGSGETRLTFFTDRKSDHYDKNARQISEVHWSPDGRKIVLAHSSRANKRDKRLGATIWVLTFAGDDDVKRRPGGRVTAPSQPAEGPGGRAYRHRSVTKEVHGRGGKQFWLYTPEHPTPKSAPVVVFNHGWGGMNPRFYGAWIEHLVRRGNVVIYPRYQASLLTNPRKFTGNALNAVKTALELLGEKGPVRPETDKIAIVGHSAGGIVAANLAALSVSSGLPAPRALMIVEPGAAHGVIRLENLDTIPKRTLALVIVGEDDDLVGDKDARRIFDSLSHISARDRDYITFFSDDHGEETLLADHLAPDAVSEDFDSGEKNRRRSRVEARLEGSVNAMDYYGFWKLLDGLTDAAFYGKNRKYALGNTPEQRFMGTWSDGTPVKELAVTDTP